MGCFHKRCTFADILMLGIIKDTMENNSTDSDENIEIIDKKKENINHIKKESIDVLKLEITNDILKSVNKRDKDNLLTIIYKSTPLATLIFLVFSYFHSVKPIFDKSEELKSKTEQLELLTKQINIKESDLKGFTKRYNELKEKKELLNNEIENQRVILSEYKKRLDESKILLSKKDKQLKNAKNAAISVHLERFINEIFPAQYEGEKNNTFDIRAYTLDYVRQNKKALNDNIYGMKALDVLEKFAKHKGNYDIERSIFFLNLFFEYNYKKKK